MRLILKAISIPAIWAVGYFSFLAVWATIGLSCSVDECTLPGGYVVTIIGLLVLTIAAAHFFSFMLVKDIIGTRKTTSKNTRSPIYWQLITLLVELPIILFFVLLSYNWFLSSG